MNIPSFDEFLATLTDDDKEEILSKASIEDVMKNLNPKTNLDMMSAISLHSAEFCIAVTFTLLRRYHDWLTKFLQ